MTRHVSAPTGARRSGTLGMVDSLLDLHRWRAISAAALVLAMLAIAALYVGQIAPLFVPADVDNPAVRRVIASDSYRHFTQPLFNELSAYSESRAPSPSASTYYVDDRLQWGLTVLARLELIEVPPVKPEKRLAGDRTAYKYLSSYQVRLDWSTLMVVLILESLLGATLHVLFRSRPARDRAAFEAQIIADHYAALRDGSRVSGPPAPSDRELLTRILLGFHTFCLRLNRRGRDRSGVLVNDEYDVQDLLSALLVVHFDNVRVEEPLPSHAGRGSRIDFLLPVLRTGIEVKFVRDPAKARDLGAELLVDAARYQAHPECTHLVCFIYDPDMHLRNPRDLVKDLTRDGTDWTVAVMVVPAR